jgi:hypothetical protein
VSSASATSPGERGRVGEAGGRDRPASGPGALPNLVIIGAQKCGTTALHYYLVQHPQISMSQPKELNFFIEEMKWRKGVDWYRRHFDPEAKIRGESSPDYTAHPWYSGVPERMHSLVPDARLIFMVRDPIERIRAQWIHNYSNRAQNRPFAEAVLEPGSTYIPRSSYFMQLERFLEHYPLSQVLVLDQDELLKRRRQTIRWVFRHLGVDDDFWHPRFKTLSLETATRRRRTPLGVLGAKRLPPKAWRRVRDKKPFSYPFDHPELSDELREELASRLRDDVARFRDLTGQRFKGWSI